MLKNIDKIKNTSSGYNCNYFLIKVWVWVFFHYFGTILLSECNLSQ